MQKSEIIEILKNKIYTCKGKLNCKVTKRTWWELRNSANIFDEVIKLTNNLPEDVTFAERLHIIIYDTQQKKCPVCKNICKFKDFSAGYFNYCSQYCGTQGEERRNKISVKNSVPNLVRLEKMKATSIKKYGVASPLLLPEFQKKMRDAKFEKWGTLDANREKSIQTCMERYGVPYSTLTPKVMEASRKLQHSRRNKFLANSEHLSILSSTMNVSQIALDTNAAEVTVELWLKKHGMKALSNKLNCSSVHQEEIFNYIEYLDIEVIKNNRKIIYPKHLDIYIPSHNFAIELNGIYWHSDIKKEKSYHLNKLNVCEEKGIRLVQFWDYEWFTKQDICKSIIKSEIGLLDNIEFTNEYIRDLSINEYSNFCNENHINGYSPASIKYGLFYDDILVSIISLAKPKSNKNYSYEIIRYGDKTNYNIRGFSKLLNYTKEKLEGSIITFIDNRIFSGKDLEECGFINDGVTQPNYWYFHYNNREFGAGHIYQKNKLKNLLNYFDPELSEYENMTLNGYSRVFDCGNIRYILQE